MPKKMLKEWDGAITPFVMGEVLDVEEGGQLTDGIIEDEDDEEDGYSRGESLRGETSKRWSRLVRCAVSLSSVVDGFTWVEGNVNGGLRVYWKRK
ncbi:uncharacterized protein HD556DRAFT_1465732 [Suillus plorans]|uniref:Uncharacterized protein n=1 Tax=Suillus plorans TaxID=116603 RepID=A0A9P7DK94_9AGAM|nr:uncharacterized protein HD556DRAFT_1465732 [Suillus plorans]KAG1796927.1 hypothetical protein HD556DRAFT_1465732 [Suillus plorans]